MGKNRNSGIGKRAERAIAEILTKITGLVFMRNPYSGSAHAWGYIKELRQRGDVICKDTSFNYSISSKRIKDFKLESLLRGSKEVLDHWDECVSDANQDSKTPLLVITQWRGERIAIMCADDVKNKKAIESSKSNVLTARFFSAYATEVIIMRLQLWAKFYKDGFV